MATITVPDQDLPDPGDALDPRPIRDYINNIVSFLESTNIDEANVDLAGTDGIVGKSTAQTITGLKTLTSRLIVNTGSGINIKDASDNGGAPIQFLGSSTTHNYKIGNQIATSGMFQIERSTATGGATFDGTNIILTVDGANTRVGIQTGTPNNHLHVETGTKNIQSGVGTLSNYGIGIEGDASAETGLCIHNNAAPMGSFSVANTSSTGMSLIRSNDGSNNLPRLAADKDGNVIIGNALSPAALATSATNGFLLITTSAGAPTGTPTAYTGKAQLHADTTNNRLYFWNPVSLAWRFKSFDNT